MEVVCRGLRLCSVRGFDHGPLRPLHDVGCVSLGNQHHRGRRAFTPLFLRYDRTRVTVDHSARVCFAYLRVSCSVLHLVLHIHILPYTRSHIGYSKGRPIATRKKGRLPFNMLDVSLVMNIPGMAYAHS